MPAADLHVITESEVHVGAAHTVSPRERERERERERDNTDLSNVMRPY